METLGIGSLGLENNITQYNMGLKCPLRIICNCKELGHGMDFIEQNVNIG